MHTMKILILTSERRVKKYSDFTMIPEDWELIYGETDKSDEELLSIGKDADAIFADAIMPISSTLITQMPHLKLIHSEGVGFNLIDVDAAKEFNVFVCNNAGANSDAVAEQAVLLMLALQRRLAEGDYMVRAGRQINAKESFILDGIDELGAGTVGLIGFGAIAKATAKLLTAFGSRVVYYSRTRLSPEDEALYNSRYLPLEDLLPQCDIVSLHLPVTAQTKNFVNRDFLAKMKPSALLINTARGEIVDQDALANAISAGTIAGAGVDTLHPEPATLDNPLLRLPEQDRYKILFSPHIGGTTDAMFFRAHNMVWKNILAVAEGKRPLNIVNGL